MEGHITEQEFLSNISIFPTSDVEYDPHNEPLFEKPYDTTRVKVSVIDKKLKINKAKTKYWLKQY